MNHTIQGAIFYLHTHRYDEYIEGHEDDDIYQEEIEVD
jgi:hypothetical protein